LIVSEPNNGQSLSLPVYPKPKQHNAKRCALVIRQRIVTALAQGDSQRSIARALRVSPSTVSAVAAQEWEQVETRKQRLAAQAERSATLAADRINAKLESSEDIPLSTLVPVFGVAVDKLAILRVGEPALTIHHQHTHSHQIELLNALNAAVVKIKTAQAAVVEVSALPGGDASVARENAAQKAADFRTISDTRTA
jgi:predicted transcriptional regulator